MNNQRRREIKKAMALLEQAGEILTEVVDDESAAKDNLPENMQETERAERMEEVVDEITDVMDELIGLGERLEEAAA